MRETEEERKEIEAAVKECLRRSWRQEGHITFAVRRQPDNSLIQYEGFGCEAFTWRDWNGQLDFDETIFSCQGEWSRYAGTVDEYVEEEYASWRAWMDEQQRFFERLVAELVPRTKNRRRAPRLLRYGEPPCLN